MVIAPGASWRIEVKLEVVAQPGTGTTWLFSVAPAPSSALGLHRRLTLSPVIVVQVGGVMGGAFKLKM